jgi:uncharacterized coiled-coil protein SlyX
MATSSASGVQPFAVWWPALVDATHAIISGGKGSGKTTLVRAVMLHLAAQGAQFVMIDPHHKRGAWGPGITPLAAGRRFEQARVAFAWGNGELDRRFKQRADHGEESFPLVVFVVDEFDLFTDKRPDVSDDLRELASRFLSMIGDESRKVGIRLIVIAHGTEVKNLGLEGRGKKRTNYTIVELQQGPDQKPEPTGTLRIGSTVWTIDTTPVLDRAAGQLQPDMLVPLPEVAHAADLSTDPIVLQQRIQELERQLSDAQQAGLPTGVVAGLTAVQEQLATVQQQLQAVVGMVRALMDRAGLRASKQHTTRTRTRTVASTAKQTTTRTPAKRTRTTTAQPAARRPRRAAQPADSIAEALAIPAIAAKVAQAQRATERRAAAYIPRVLRLCWTTALSPQEIADGQGTLSPTTVRRIQAACAALVTVELLDDAGAGRYRVNEEQISRLRQLARAVTK